jgi:hypothetical protein
MPLRRRIRHLRGTNVVSASDEILINRAPVLTLWAAVVAERLGFRHDEALTLGRAVAGLNAYSKGKALGLFAPTPKEVAERRRAMREKQGLAVDLLGRAVPCVATDGHLRAVSGDRPIAPESVERYLAGKFGGELESVRSAMTALAKSMPSAKLAGRAYSLYEAFRPDIPGGKKGWGAAGVLSLKKIRSLAS